MVDVILDTLLDTAKLLPFLFLTYLLMEYLEHRSGNATGRLLGRSGRVGPLIGGLLGIVPQCGFSAAAAGLYAGRVVTVGTLLSVWLSTSDEMLPILISHGVPVGFLFRFLAVKVFCGVAAGFAVDAVCRLGSLLGCLFLVALAFSAGGQKPRRHCQRAKQTKHPK